MTKISINDNQALTALLKKAAKTFTSSSGQPPELTLEECQLLGEFNHIMDLVKTILNRGTKFSHDEQSSLLFLLHQGLFEYQNKVEDDGNLNRDFTLCQCIEAQIRGKVANADEAQFSLIREIIASMFDVGMSVNDDFLNLVNETEYDFENDDEPEVELNELVKHMEVLAKEIHAESCYDVYLQVAEQLNQMPPDAGLLIITGLLHAADPMVRDSAILFLLHPQSKVRDSLLEGLVALAQQNLLNHYDFERLMTIRRWVDEDTRQVIDQTIKLLQRKQVSLLAREPSRALPLQAIWVTPIDNSGSMILQVVFKVGRKLRLIGCILKQIYGIKDAYSSALMSQTEYKKILAKSSDVMPIVEISLTQLIALLNHFLVENLVSQRQVPIELLMLCEYLENNSIMPQKLTLPIVDDISQSIPVKQPAPLELEEFLYGWGSPELRRGHRSLKAIIENEFESNREIWLERLLLSLLCFESVVDEGEQFRHCIQHILKGRPLASSPFFKQIAKIILEADQPEEPDEIPTELSEAMIQQVLAENPDLLESIQSMQFAGSEYSPRHLKTVNQWPVKDRPKRAVYQLKISLQGSKPVIWRRLLVMNTISLEKLHGIIQLSMGWDDFHWYEFSDDENRFGSTDELEYNGPAAGGFFDDRNVQLRDLVHEEKDKLTYIYDFADQWKHQIVLEKIIPASRKNTPIQVVAGKGACPPEDVGGIAGYAHMLKVLKKPTHEEYDDFVAWLGLENPAEFDPGYFDLDETNLYLNQFFN